MLAAEKVDLKIKSLHHKKAFVTARRWMLSKLNVIVTLRHAHKSESWCRTPETETTLYVYSISVEMGKCFL